MPINNFQSAPSNFQIATATIQAADIHSGGNPITLVPAPGVGVAIIILALAMRYKRKTTDFVLGTISLSTAAGNVGWSQTVGGGFWDQGHDAYSFETTSNFGAVKVGPMSDVDNSPAIIQAGSSNNVGDGSLEVVCYYAIVNLP